MKENKRILKRRERGITLIALVITIIVLLILAGISIGAITGDNGIIKQAQNAKDDTQYAQWEEQIDVAIIDAESKNRDTTMDDVIEELINKEVINDESQVDKETGTITTNEPSYVIEDKLNDYIVKLPTLAEITGNETTNTESKDNLGNKVVVPAGFKVVNPDDNVENGIIIEDVSHGATEGSQFVWIPIGEIKKTDGSTVLINLERYDFDYETGEPKKYQGEYTEDTKETHSNTQDNVLAKDIDEFKEKALASKGYYIGRYEARDGVTQSARNSSTSDTNQLVCKADNYVYNFITEPQAAQLCRNMYNDKNFESDLVNSYAWDTAVLFLLRFDDRKIKNTPYSIQGPLYTDGTLGGGATKGSNNLSAELQDQVCNIWDMAGNYKESSTETTNNRYGISVSLRGGDYYMGGDSSYRTHQGSNISNDTSSFRPILYL